MKNILLFYPSLKFGISVQPRIELPQSLLTIATPLDKAGYSVTIIDQRVDGNWREHLVEAIKNNPLCVGISSMTGPQIKHGLEVSRLVKEHTTIPVVWGGIHPTLLPEQTLKNENIDIVVQGEGEETFFELVQALENGSPLSKIQGIWYKQNGKIKNTPHRPLIDLNNQPPLAYHLVDIDKYKVKLFGRDHLSLETSRGCPLKCNYCYNTKVYNSSWRSLSVDETIKRMKILLNEFGIRDLILTDDNFFGNKERAIKIFQRIKDEKLELSFSKVDGPSSLLAKLTDNELNLIKEAGARMLVMGLESGSPRLLKVMKKPVNIPELIKFNKRLKEFAISPVYFFMIGIPTESLDELSQSVSLYLKLIKDNEDTVSHLNVYTPFPGTGLYEISLEKGLQVPSSLEQWIPFNWRNINDKSPWLDKKRKKIIRMLHFSTLFTGKNTFLNPYKKTNPLVVFLAKMYYPIAKKRVENLWYQFPIEIKLAEWLGVYPKQL